IVEDDTPVAEKQHTATRGPSRSPGVRRAIGHARRNVPSPKLDICQAYVGAAVERTQQLVATNTCRGNPKLSRRLATEPRGKGQLREIHVIELHVNVIGHLGCKLRLRCSSHGSPRPLRFSVTNIEAQLAQASSRSNLVQMKLLDGQVVNAEL